MNVRNIAVVKGSCQTIESNKSLPLSLGRTARVVVVIEACEDDSDEGSLLVSLLSDSVEEGL